MEKAPIIVQARMGSTRLPGKILKPVCGLPLLTHLIMRLKKCRYASHIIIATSINPENDPLEPLCKELQVGLYRGSEEDVLSRYIEAAKELNATYVTRITGDCPLICPEVVDHCIKHAVNSQSDLVGCTTYGGYPRGFDCEVVRLDALKKIHQLDTSKANKEHVTWGIKNREDIFKIESLKAPKEYFYPKLRLCVDEELDFQLVEAIYRALYKGSPIDSKAILSFLSEHPELATLNSQVKQKSV